MLKVTVKSISITDIGFVVFLSNYLRKKVLPIFIGPVEAQAISLFLIDNKPKRPMTHDLAHNIIGVTGFSIDRIEINEFNNGTYFASLYLSKNRLLKKVSKKTVIDSRPSDAIALAIRSGSPIYISPSLFDEHSIDIDDDLKEETGDPSSKVSQIKKMGFSKRINDEIGVYKQMLKEAIKEERFEDASKIRDKIETMIQSKN